jgi:hypothetical protein
MQGPGPSPRCARDRLMCPFICVGAISSLSSAWSLRKSSSLLAVLTLLGWAFQNAKKIATLMRKQFPSPCHASMNWLKETGSIITGGINPGSQNTAEPFCCKLQPHRIRITHSEASCSWEAPKHWLTNFSQASCCAGTGRPSQARTATLVIGICGIRNADGATLCGLVLRVHHSWTRQNGQNGKPSPSPSSPQKGKQRGNNFSEIWISPHTWSGSSGTNH